MATFGQLAAVADRHRSEVHEALRHPDITVRAGRPGSLNELGRLARVLTRYTDRIAHGFGLPSDDGAHARDIARRAGASLRHATAYLDRARPEPEQNTTLAQNLRASAVALGCGLDLLSTHLPSPDSGRNPTSVAAVISAPDTAGDLFRLINKHATTAGRLALNSGPITRPAGQFLLRAAALTGMFGHTPTRDTGLNAVALPGTPDRIPPEADEDRDQLIAGIDASVRRLDASQAEGSVTTWRYLARAAAITHQLDRHLLCVLRVRLEELGQSQTADQLWPVIKSMHHTALRWRNVTRVWHELTTDHQGPEIGPATDASDLILRLGRLGYTDPAWRPGHRAQPATTDPAQLAPTMSEVTRIGLTVITTLGVCDQIAEQHRRAINDLVRTGRLTATNPKAVSHRREIDKLRHHYPANRTAGRQVISRLAHLLHANTPDLGSEATLTLRSAALPSPAALAGADCPLPALTEETLNASPPAPAPFHQPTHPHRPSPHL
ncbi:hypothetical protein EBO15_14540 [Actinomadura harenae]|uniref:Uncharacterized protein n=2 Tax=Actinomadura harenae TaxID=2483351 RepID=A0A3M2M9V9_9ACTN|nr:hypothetical protein EBO15_14540 [Actinomadura harenae]